MAKQIRFTDPATGKDYILEYNRISVMRMEKQGFYINEEVLSQRSLTTLLTLFHGAFWLHHRSVTLDEAAGLMERFSDKSGLIQRLMEMYMEPTMAISGAIDNRDEDDPEDDRKNLITWS